MCNKNILCVQNINILNIKGGGRIETTLFFFQRKFAIEKNAKSHTQCGLQLPGLIKIGYSNFENETCGKTDEMRLSIMRSLVHFQQRTHTKELGSVKCIV
jgi:hypothetical protein